MARLRPSITVDPWKENLNPDTTALRYPKKRPATPSALIWKLKDNNDSTATTSNERFF